MKNTDKKNLGIFKFWEKKNILFQKKFNDENNLIHIFFHDLMRYFSSYIINLESNENKYELINFPFINKDYAKRPYRINHFPKIKQASFYNIFFFRINCAAAYFLKKIFGYRIFLISKKSGYSINIRKLFFSGLFSGKFILINVHENRLIKDYSVQTKLLEECILELCIKLKVRNKNIFTKNFINYIDEYSKFANDNFYNFIIKKSDFLVGTVAKTVSRIHAINFKNNKRKVIILSHGFQDFLILDDPITAYAEAGPADYVFSYGKGKLKHGKYNKPIKGQNPKYIYRTSDIIKNIYRSKIINHKVLDDVKILYVPTAFHGGQRYGPFRDLSDKEYLDWQNKLISAQKLTVKRHPKDQVLIGHNSLAEINKMPLLEVSNLFDVFVIDHLSTASAILFATNKPIIYFDLGHQNVNPEVLKVIKKRVYYFNYKHRKISIRSLKKDFKSYNHNALKKINNYTENYSIKKKNVSEFNQIKNFLSIGSI